MSKNTPVSTTFTELQKVINSNKRQIESLSSMLTKGTSRIVLEEKKSQEQKKLEECYWFNFIGKRKCHNEIEELDNHIKVAIKIEDLEERNEELTEKQKDYCHGTVWKGYPENLNAKKLDEYARKFKTLVNPILTNIPEINIIMIGETGAGKSSFLNTFATALENSEEIKDVCRVSPQGGKEKSATKRIHLEDLVVGKEKQKLACRFFDIPGLDMEKTITKNDLDQMIDGKLEMKKGIKEIQQMNKREDPKPAHMIHCILYVINAKSSLDVKMSPNLQLMKEIQRARSSEDGVRQFVIVTAIDELGVPNEDIENAYKYGCVRKFCEKVSKTFEISLTNVIPVSNYCGEATPSTAKNAMSLFNLLRVFYSGISYIKRQWGNEN